MNIAIVGAGIIGVTTAFELASDGHAVTVFERRASVAEETSFANAGLIAPGFLTPWALAGLPRRALQALLLRHPPLKLTWPLALHELRWLAAWRRACRPEAVQLGRERLQALAVYSRQRLHEMSEALQLQYECSPGLLVVLRTDKERKQLQPALALLKEAGVRFREISPEGARAVEPALNPDAALAGAVHLPDEGVANCRQVAVLLRKAAQALGVRFEFNSTVAPLEPASATTLQVSTTETGLQQQRFDAVVVCSGAASAPVLRRLGVRLPLQAVHGYSISAGIGEPLNAPRSAVVDERHQIVVSRLGNRVRVSGHAELGGREGRRHPASIAVLYKVLQDWFPGAAHLSGCGAGVQEWKGAQAMLPDGSPVLGASGVPGVWLNVGHGASGWSLACGSARVLADLVGGHEPAVELDGLGIARWLA